MGLGTDISFLYKMVQLALCVRRSPLPHPDIFITLWPLPEARCLTTQVRVLFSLGNLRVIKKIMEFVFICRNHFFFLLQKERCLSLPVIYMKLNTETQYRQRKEN